MPQFARRRIPITASQPEKNSISRIFGPDSADVDVFEDRPVHRFERDGRPVGVVDSEIPDRDMREGPAGGRSQLEGAGAGAYGAMCYINVFASAISDFGLQANPVVVGIEKGI